MRINIICFNESLFKGWGFYNGLDSHVTIEISPKDAKVDKIKQVLLRRSLSNKSVKNLKLFDFRKNKLPNNHHIIHDDHNVYLTCLVQY